MLFVFVLGDNFVAGLLNGGQDGQSGNTFTLAGKVVRQEEHVEDDRLVEREEKT